MFICTIYAHSTGFEKVINSLQKTYPQGKLSISEQGDSTIATLEIKGGLFSKSKKIKISYRERSKLDYKFPVIDDSLLTTNLKGMYEFVSTLTAENEQIKSLLLKKIQSLNCEFSIEEAQGHTKEIKDFIQAIVQELDAILFVQPDNVISRSSVQHFLDKNLHLIIDIQGKSEIEDLEVIVKSKYFDEGQDNISEDQMQRKQKNESLLKDKNIKINQNLPYIVSEKEAKIRTTKEVAHRVTILAITNMVACDTISADEAREYLKEYDLLPYLTSDEYDFLNNPTEQKKINETWKCECIWTLMWALKKVNDLAFPNKLCNLNVIAPENYPIGNNKNPYEFINSDLELRSIAEILDANDFYYRLDWACVDARIKGMEMEQAKEGVVYERHYALNWLINYRNQDWDNITCDT